MAEETRKTYFHIVEMTEKFRQSFPNATTHADSVAYWQLAIQLAQAQQLSVIAGELKNLREAFLTAAGKK